jgi:hypothetical protein
MHRLPPPRPLLGATTCWLSALLIGCLPTEGEPGSGKLHEPDAAVETPDDRAASERPQSGGGPALRLLAGLAVKPRAPRTGYARGEFGRPWVDVDRNGCDTHDDILRRDLTATTLKPGTRPCVVLSGTLADPYTGAQIRHAHGVFGVDVDHVVALGDAWDKGAAQWAPEKRLALANDPLNLLAVDASANRSKGASDAATWLPPNHAYHCKYVARQIAVKAKYQLSLTRDEHDAMAAVLATCPDEPAPVGDAPTHAPIAHVEREPSAPTPTPRPAAPAAPSPPHPTPPAVRPAATDPNYGTCKQARANHRGPYVRGQDPEYDYYQDRDGDGIVCE